MTTRQRGLLITGTDTGVGKTFIACGLAGSLRRQGFRVAPFKPAETGCAPDPESQALIPADAEMLRRATATQATLETICPYRFRAPLAPWVAAELEGASIDPQRLERCYRELSGSHDFVLVETAGGILVPLAENFHYADLARLLHLPVLVVIGSKLGAINHTLLTLELLRSAGLTTVACVLNHPDREMDSAVATNEHTLRRLVRVPLYVVANHMGGDWPWDNPGFDALASDVARCVDRLRSEPRASTPRR